MHAIASRIVLDAGEVEDLREDSDALPDRFALPASRMQRGDQLGNVGRRDLVDAS